LPWRRVLAQHIANGQSAAVFVGAEGIDPWQHQELDALLRKFVERARPVIPVLLSKARQPPISHFFWKE